MRGFIACALTAALLCANIAGAVAAPAQAQVTNLTIAQNGGNTVVDMQMQGSAQFQWHRLRDPDNRFWVDIIGAQLVIPARDDVEPAPLGGIRLRQIDPQTVRLALSLTAPKVLDVLSTPTGLRIVVHPENAGDDLARAGGGVTSSNVAAVTPATQLERTSRTVAVSNGNSNGPSAAQIASIEQGKSPNIVPAPNSTPVSTESSSNQITQPEQTAEPTATPDSSSSSGDTTQGPSAAQIAQMTGQTTPTPNPLLTGTSNSPVEWKFAPRSSYVATNPRLIVIDPGHGGSDRGAIRGSLEEAVVNLDMAKRLRDILVARGWQVIMTRTTDVDVYKPNDSAHDELQARVDVGNVNGARLFVSIHSNSYINADPSGTTTYYSKQLDVPLATDVQSQLAGTLGTQNDGIVKSHLYVTLHTDMPAILVETAFLSNPGDYAKLASSQWRQKVAQGIADGIEQYAGAPPSH